MTRDLILIALSLATWGVGEGMFFYFQPLYLEELGAEPLAIGAILGGYGIATTVAHIPAGIAADRLGRKPVMLAAWLAGSAAAWIMALAQNLTLFVSGMLLYGLTIFVAAPLNSYATAARGRYSAGRVLTLLAAAMNLGVVIGPWIGGRIGAERGLRQTYLVAAVLFLISTAIFLPIRDQPRERLPQGLRAGAELRRNKAFVGLLGVMLLAMAAMYLPQVLAPNFLQNQKSISLERIGWLYSMSGVGIVVLNLVLGQFDARTGFLLSQAAVGAFTALLWQGSGFAWYALAYFLLGGYRSARSLAMALVRSVVHPATMGLAFGLTETMAAAATILTPPLAGYLYGIRPEVVYPVSLALALAALLASYVVSTRRSSVLQAAAQPSSED